MELLPDFDLVRPATVEAAVEAWRGHAAARYLSGGTDLIPNMRRGLVDSGRLVDLSAVDELRRLGADDSGLHLGAAVTLAEVAEEPAVASAWRALAEAAGTVAGPTQRMMGTVGGNLCLDTRCYFYNQSQWWRQSNDFCLKYEGEICHVVPSSKRCYAAYSGDLAPALLVLGAEVEVAGPEGRRRMPVAELFRDDGADYLTLAEGELVAAVHVPPSAPGLASSYEKIRVRGSIDFPLAGVAAAVARQGETVGDLRVALTGTNPLPLLLTGTQDLVGGELDEAALTRLEKLVQKRISPVRTSLTHPQYRRRAISGVARRLVERLFAGD